jgi:antitoxin ParD1/3/4
MPSKNALNVSLTEQLCEFVATQVASGRYRTASEVLRAALRSLERELAETGLTAPRSKVSAPAGAVPKSRSRPPVASADDRSL